MTVVDAVFVRANQPWDRTWSVERPADYTPGLYRVHQVIAHHLLKHDRSLTNWAAQFLQVVAYQSADLSSIQTYWLNRLDRAFDGRVAA